jgi:predicted nucleic acid-binding protein
VIVVDTTVWIDFLGAKRTSFGLHLADLIGRGESLALTDLIYCEVLPGIRDGKDLVRVRSTLRSYPILRMQGLDLFEYAADLYRACRRRGFTIRKTIDPLVATCLETEAELYHKDSDFDFNARVSDLRIYRP